MSQYIAASFVYGDSLKNCLVAIVVVEEAKAKEWCTANGKEDACSDPEFKKLIMNDMMRIASENNLNSLEKPKEIVLTLNQFTIENADLQAETKRCQEGLPKRDRCNVRRIGK